jgi:hypothetical protein
MFTELSFPETAFWFVVGIAFNEVGSNGVGSNLSCEVDADETALNEMWEPLLDACGI